jgi:hypothetical protein
MPLAINAGTVTVDIEPDNRPIGGYLFDGMFAIQEPPSDGGPIEGGGIEPQKPKYSQERVDEIAKACVQKIELLLQNDEVLRDIILGNKQGNQSFALTLAHAATESSFFTDAIGAQGEIGLFQVKLSTANGLGLGTFTKADLLRADVNTRVGTYYLQTLVDSYGDLRTALGAYKQGNSAKNGLTVSSQEYADGILKCADSVKGLRGIR